MVHNKDENKYANSVCQESTSEQDGARNTYGSHNSPPPDNVASDCIAADSNKIHSTITPTNKSTPSLDVLMNHKNDIKANSQIVISMLSPKCYSDC